jgi:hypothetical protein
MIFGKLNKFILTETLSQMENELLKFMNNTEPTHKNHGADTNERIDDGISDDNANEDFMEILKLRHINLAK